MCFSISFLTVYLTVLFIGCWFYFLGIELLRFIVNSGYELLVGSVTGQDSHSVAVGSADCFLAIRKLFIFMKSHLLILGGNSCAIDVLFCKLLPTSMS